MTKRPNGVSGEMSPKPTVPIVTTAQYMPVGMLVNPCSGPSTTYISAPKITTIVINAQTNTEILRRLRAIAVISTLASLEYCTSLSTRNTRSRRSTRITSRYWLPANTSER